MLPSETSVSSGLVDLLDTLATSVTPERASLVGIGEGFLFVLLESPIVITDS